MDCLSQIKHTLMHRLTPFNGKSLKTKLLYFDGAAIDLIASRVFSIIDVTTLTPDPPDSNFEYRNRKGWSIEIFRVSYRNKR
jgi:hypothetical protein